MRAALESDIGFFVEGQTTSAPNADDKKDSILSGKDLTRATTDMLEEISGVIDRGGTYPIPSTQYHPEHQAGDFDVEGDIRYEVNSVPEIAKDMLEEARTIILRRKWGKRRERVELTAGSKPRLVYKETDGIKTITAPPVNSPAAVDAARGVIGDFAQLNGNVLRVSNHRGIVYKAA